MEFKKKYHISKLQNNLGNKNYDAFWSKNDDVFLFFKKQSSHDNAILVHTYYIIIYYFYVKKSWRPPSLFSAMIQMMDAG